jgi:formate--tetrahydrofolate ligase
LGNIFVGFTYDGNPIYARDLKASGAMTALLRDTIMPNLVQTSEGNAAIIHGGPFANIAQGTNSVVATKMAMSLSDYVVTEAGFAFDLGAEKFFDIKCGYSGLSPKAVVLVATVKALKYHGGADLKTIHEPNADAVERGLGNLEKHLENILAFGIGAAVAINKFTTDTDEEIQIIKDRCKELGVTASVADVWAKGGEGAVELAEIACDIARKCEKKYIPTYDWNWDIPKKVETIATKIYGAKAVEYAAKAKADLEKIQKLGLEKLPICMAKTQSSLSDNPKLLGRPENFLITVREIEIAAGAGFVIPILGEIMRMPGLPVFPAAENIDVDENGNIEGLF